MKIGVIYPQTELQGDPHAVHRIGLATKQLGFDHLEGLTQLGLLCWNDGCPGSRSRAAKTHGFPLR